LNLPYFIAKRIGKTEEKGFSSTIHKIAVACIGLGLAIMIVSFLIFKGFQYTVKEKIYDFSAHFQVRKYVYGFSYEEPPMSVNTPLFNHPEEYDFVKHVQEYAHKAGLIKTEEEVLGVVLKGVSRRYDQEIFGEYLKKGRFIHFSDSGYSSEVVLSQVIADKLKLDVGNEIIIHFFQDPPRSRKLNVVGIYETNLSEYFDDKIVIGDIGLIRRLNNWADSIAGGMEIFIDNPDKADELEAVLDGLVEQDQYVEKVSDKYVQVFEWLELIRRQVNIFLVIILVVVCINMISIILIMIMERTQMIGVLKAMGSPNEVIRKVFGYSGALLIIKGLSWGNLLGIGLCAIQYYTGVITLNAKDYYMSEVPIGWSWEIIVALNALTFVIVAVIMFLPTVIISGVQPIKTIRFD